MYDNGPTYYVVEFSPAEGEAICANCLSLQLVKKEMVKEKSFFYTSKEETKVTPLSEPAIFNTEGRKIILFKKAESAFPQDEKNIYIMVKS